MTRLEGRIGQTARGRRWLALMPDYMIEELSKLPPDTVFTPYIVSITRRDILELIAGHLEIPV
jgi:hypothetical protein